ncbi:MAG: hypothetical protein ABI306_03315 [Caulobacteraceae bacterium]
MTTKTISTYVPGYVLAPQYAVLDITPTGSVGYGGVYAPSPAYVFNYGSIHAGANVDGIRLAHGGAVYNGKGVFSPVIEGGVGIRAQFATLTVTNYGSIVGTHGSAVEADVGGALVNGTASDTAALIESAGYAAIAAPRGAETVVNFGTILALLPGGGYGSPIGVYLHAGGAVTNGATADTTARIEGRIGVEVFGAARVTNFGTIAGLTPAFGYGVRLHNGGPLANGAVTDTAALILGGSGVDISGSATVTNFGAIRGLAVGRGAHGLRLQNGGVVVNGAAGDPIASIEGYTGVAILGAAGTVTNFGTVRGDGAENLEFGVNLRAGGGVYNGGASDRSALIVGYGGVKIAGVPGRVDNYGTIQATGAYTGYRGGADDYGVALAAGGAVINGSINDTTALIEGEGGLELYGAAGAINFGTIASVGIRSGVGVVLASAAESLTNEAGAVVRGPSAMVVLGAGDTVTNFGAVQGVGGVAVEFALPTDVLVVEAGSSFVGAVLGGGGVLVLGSGVGALTGRLASGNVTVSGAIAPTSFNHFDTVEIGAAARFTIAGGAMVGAGQALIDAGSLTLRGGLANGGVLSVSGGTLTVDGAVTGAGMATIAGGTLDLEAGFSQNIAFTAGAVAGVLRLAESRRYGGAVSGFSTAGSTFLDLADIAFVGAGEATFSGTKTGGVLTVTDGAHTAHIKLTGDYLSATFVAANDGHGGVIVHAQAHRLIAAMAGLGAGGAGPLAARPDAWRPDLPILGKPAAMIA